jgi:hypothetical protein
MKNLAIFGAMALVLGLSPSAFAADTETLELYAVSQLATGTTMATMSDRQLTSVEGMSYSRHHDCGCRGGYGRSSSSYTSVYQNNDLSQANLNFGGGKYSDVSQANFALQSNKAIVR